MAKEMNALHMASWVLCTIGALNWGLVGALNYNLVASLLGAGSMAARIVYVIIGLAGLLSVWHMIQWSRQ